MSDELFEKVRRRSNLIPYLTHLGIELLECGEGWVTMKMAFRPEFLQPSVIHGGAVYSLADASAAHALLTLVASDEPIATVEQHINFLAGVACQDLYCEAKIIRFGRTLSYAEATVTSDSGMLVAKSGATLMRRRNLSSKSE